MPGTVFDDLTRTGQANTVGAGTVFEGLQNAPQMDSKPTPSWNPLPTLWQDVSGIPSVAKQFLLHPINTTDAAVRGFVNLPDTMATSYGQGRPGEALARMIELGLPGLKDIPGPGSGITAPLIAGAKAAAPDIGMGAAKIGLGFAGEELFPGPGKYVLGILPTYAGGRQIMRGLNKGFAAARESMKGVTKAAPAEDTQLLDGLAQGFTGKKSAKFASLNAEDQAQIRSLADRIKENPTQSRSMPPPPPALPPLAPQTTAPVMNQAARRATVIPPETGDLARPIPVRPPFDYSQVGGVSAPLRPPLGSPRAPSGGIPYVPPQALEIPRASLQMEPPGPPLPMTPPPPKLTADTVAEWLRQGGEQAAQDVLDKLKSRRLPGR